MARGILSIFFILHGLVHLLYAGQSRRLFELRPQMIWPDGSWAFSNLLGSTTTRWIVSISLVLATLGFMTGGLGLIIRQAWWHPVIVGTAVFSSAIYLLCWDGKFRALDDQGGVGLLINLAVLVVVLILQWPSP